MNEIRKKPLVVFRKKITYILLTFLISVSCGKKEEQINEKNLSKDFSWKSELKITDIPDMPVKGYINGKEISLNYINFEQWRGSRDNILNFGDTRPKNNCGYVESDNSIHLIRKADEIKPGEFLKSSFEQNLDGYISYYDTLSVKDSDKKTSLQWNCALVITEMNEKTVKGKIALCFKDDKKSWVAGSFEAVRCNN